MAFRFNFSADVNVGSRSINNDEPVVKKQKIESVAEFKEITADDCKTVYPCDLEVDTHKFSEDVLVLCYNAGAIEEILKKDKDTSSTVVKATSCHTDLVPNVYEGGLTVWECGLDLGSYLAKHLDFTDKTVLELGCGAGIPGICAMYLGAKEIHFQDYNSEVIEEYTIPNVIQLNKEEDMNCTCRFFSGDWSEFEEKIDQYQKYDVILTAETIYNPDNYKKLHDVFTSRSNKDGSIYISAKSNYFGVGGGTRLFQDFIDEMQKFKCEISDTIATGVPREILKLTWKEKTLDKEKT